MLNDAIDYLNRNAGLVVAIATVVYAFLTWRLLNETQAARSEAHVEAVLEPWSVVPQYAVVTVQNLGPGLARDLVIDIHVDDGNINAEVDRHHLAQQIMAAGQRRIFTLSADGASAPTEKLIGRRATIRASWQWSDGRRNLLRRRKVHKGSWTRDAATIDRDYYQSGANLEGTVVDELHRLNSFMKEGVQELRKELTARRLERLAERRARMLAAQSGGELEGDAQAEPPRESVEVTADGGLNDLEATTEAGSGGANPSMRP